MLLILCNFFKDTSMKHISLLLIMAIIIATHLSTSLEAMWRHERKPSVATALENLANSLDNVTAALKEAEEAMPARERQEEREGALPSLWKKAKVWWQGPKEEIPQEKEEKEEEVSTEEELPPLISEAEEKEAIKRANKFFELAKNAISGFYKVKSLQESLPYLAGIQKNLISASDLKYFSKDQADERSDEIQNEIYYAAAELVSRITARIDAVTSEDLEKTTAFISVLAANMSKLPNQKPATKEYLLNALELLISFRALLENYAKLQTDPNKKLELKRSIKTLQESAPYEDIKKLADKILNKIDQI
jgi:hypothetical protein